MYTTTAVSIYQPVTKHAIVSVREKEHVAMAIPIRRRKATRIDRGEKKKQQTNSIDPNGLCENMVVMKTKIHGERGRSIVPTTPVGHARNSAEQIITFILELMPVNAGEQNCTLFV